MEEVPSLRDELNRKTLESVEKLNRDLNTGRINEGQFAYGLDILWSAVAGLVDSDFTIMAELMGDSIPPNAMNTKTCFYNAEKGWTVEIVNTHNGKFTFSLYRAGLPDSVKVYDFTEESNPTLEAMNKFKDVCANLEANGFKQL